MNRLIYMLIPVLLITLLTGCSSDKTKVEHKDNSESAMDIRLGADYEQAPEVFTDEIISDIYGVDFYSAHDVELVQDDNVWSNSVFKDLSHNKIANTCAVNAISWFGQANINYTTGYLSNVTQWTPDIVYMDVVVDDYTYTFVAAITDKCEDGYAKFLVEKKVTHADAE